MTENLIEKMSYKTLDMGSTGIGRFIMSCKFSKQENNLHIFSLTTAEGKICIYNTLENTKDNPDVDNTKLVFKSHNNIIYDHAWADSSMTFVTASADQTSKIFQLLPSGAIEQQNIFNFESPVKSAKFCPGSSDVLCGKSQDGKLKVWDVRFKRLALDIPDTPGNVNIFTTGNEQSCVLFQDNNHIITCSTVSCHINVWDLRKSYGYVQGNIKPLPLKKYYCSNPRLTGFVDMHLNPQSSLLYASGFFGDIFCFSLESTQRTPIHQFTGHSPNSIYSRISISHDGKYIFSACSKYSGVIWTTQLPHIKKPIFKLNHTLSVPAHRYLSDEELSVSAWCSDPNTHPKLVTCASSLYGQPLLWSVQTIQNENDSRKFIRTPEGKTNSN